MNELTPTKHCYLAVNLGNWSRGKTLIEAVKNLPRAKGIHIIYLIMNDEEAQMNSYGDIIRHVNSELFQVAKFKSRPNLVDFTY